MKDIPCPVCSPSLDTPEMAYCMAVATQHERPEWAALENLCPRHASMVEGMRKGLRRASS